MEHLTHEEFVSYGSSTLASSGLLSADRHLAECSECRTELRRTVAAPILPALVLEMGNPVHLTFEQISTYVEASIDESERDQIEAHMNVCQSCREEVLALKFFDASMAIEFKTVPLVGAVDTKESPFVRLRGSLADFVHRFWMTPSRVRLAGTGIGLMLLGIVNLVKVQAADSMLRDGSPAAAHMTMLSVSAHPNLFLGSSLILGGGAIALLYGIFKR